ncbi:MAG: hypothetical protein H7843_13530 [Nitrospirota bacterium]|uniref:Uncharacterized protein n=1 Tax=Candidatus Magnetominusculus xianensis TaxID=1748249 RepID=A0ABR5SFR3_9BACT|nr:hypothetical protein [Candidatus Magnetominusculus xianensis]KWT86790.1 hypothetical protein ASN18_1513 [Candidatus Magnetominusculus xianensis]MBF0402492.1 hypothetical protein [Nitrospirota bacterium]
MENPRKKMIEDLATSDNYFAIRELVGLFPEISFEHHKRLFQDAFDAEKCAANYGISKIPNKDHYKAQRIEIVNPSYQGDNFFRFAICVMGGVGDNVENWYFGIIGPWNLSTQHKEIQELKDNCTKLGLKPSANWMYKYFKSQRSDVFASLMQGADVKPIILSMVREFNDKCQQLVELVDQINAIL